MPPPNPTSGEAAQRALRRAIMRLELPPGAAVSEGLLMERFGFSKAATRAALARLRADGLVESEPRRGHVVARLTMRDVLEIYDLRLLLEPPAARRAAGRIEPAELARLQELAQTALTGTGERFLRANHTIHRAIVAAAGNRRTTAIVERLLEDSERARRVALQAGAARGGERARTELREVLAALAERDGERAEALQAAAIAAFRDELVESLRRAALDIPLGIADL